MSSNHDGNAELPAARADKPGEQHAGMMWCYNSWTWHPAEECADTVAGEAAEEECRGADALMRYYNG